MKKLSLIVLSLLIVCVTSCLHLYIEHNKKAGNNIIEKIESYKNINGFLPNTLQDIGQDEIIDNVLFCYQKKDSVNYIVWFGTTVGEGIYYYSDTQQWEDKLREMKE
jgi:hypothetical protein